ncbi:MAG TPA: hypothetical protein VIJ38_01685 [Acidobacteriaceae bacterium]
MPPITNEQRAMWADSAIEKFKEETGQVHSGDANEEVLADLICDLIHWADHIGVDFEAAFETATMNYEAEEKEELDEQGTEDGPG